MQLYCIDYIYIILECFLSAASARLMLATDANKPERMIHTPMVNVLECSARMWCPNSRMQRVVWIPQPSPS